MQKKKGAEKNKMNRPANPCGCTHTHTHTHCIFYGTEKLAVVAKVYFAYKKNNGNTETRVV